MNGKIIDIDGKSALVEICSNVQELKASTLQTHKSKDSDKLLALAQLRSKHEVGDELNLELTKQSMPFANWFLYFIPLVALIIGTLIGMVLKDEMYMFIIGGGCLFVSLVVTFFLGRFVEGKFHDILIEKGAIKIKTKSNSKKKSSTEKAPKTTSEE